MEACVVDLEVRGSSLARRVVSLDKELYSNLALLTQMCKWVPATYCWPRAAGGEGNPAIDQDPVQGRVAILRGKLHVKETGISSGQGTGKICLL